MFEFKSAEQYQSQLLNGSVSCLEAVEHYLEQEKKYRHLNAFVQLFTQEALQRARELDVARKAGMPMGRMHGVVVGIKDVLCFKGHPVTAASGILQNFISLYSATAVERLIQEEAIILGTLNCDEFAMGSSSENSYYGKVLNALDETRVPGGSSGGSAVAVQAGLCMISLGSDTGGSVRQPADFCGVIGLKPGYGRISRYGLIAYASSFDQIGIFARSVKDAALTLEIIAGHDEQDSTVSQKEVPSYLSLLAEKKKFRFACIADALQHPGLDPEIRTAIEDSCHKLEQQGHRISFVPFEWFDYVVPAYYILTTAEASSNLSRYDGVRYGTRSPDPILNIEEMYCRSRTEGFGREVKRRIMLGSFVLSAGYYDAYFTRAQKVRRLVSERLQSIFQDHDFILMPNSPFTAFRSGEKTGDPVAMYLADIYTVIANLAGLPAISLPLYRHSNGMPFGLQLAANRFDEVSLLQASTMLCP